MKRRNFLKLVPAVIATAAIAKPTGVEDQQKLGIGRSQKMNFNITRNSKGLITSIIAIN